MIEPLADWHHDADGMWRYGADPRPFTAPPQADAAGGWIPPVPAPVPTAIVSGPARPAWWRNRWAHLGAAFVVGLAIGGAGGSSSAADAEKRAVAAETRAKTAEEDAKDARSDAAEAEARAQRAAEDASKAVADQERTLKDRERALVARERAVGVAEARAQASSFGDGVHVVGVDIQPGTYRAEGGNGCYWAKLRQNDSIIDNDLLDGPTTVTIDSTTYKFKTSDCGTWTRR